ncbi:MAG: ABC transporter substrate-binding protein [Gemmatimonadota bacterium]|nr:ABC transporter substrate-binding protein [Gemmatimonadota bacterium]
MALRRAAVVASLLLLAACASPSDPPAGQAEVDALAHLPWDSVLARARGTEVVWRMWRGDPSINAYVDGWVAPRLRERYGVTLRAVEGQGPELVNQLVIEREAGRRKGSASLLWINGETFGNLRRERLLAGPWAGRLPAAAYVDSTSPIVMRDFEQDPAGYESPWGRVQFALIYDSIRTPEPPRSFAELAQWIRAHPGRFTYDQGFTGTTFLKMLMYAEGGGAASFAGGFDSTHYFAAREHVFAWLDSLRPFLWRAGATYPPDVATMHRLFANGEIDFSMSNNQNEVVTKVRQHVLPATARALVLRDGTIANSHYLGIPWNAPNAAGAMIVADFLLSPEAQLEKQKPEVWADGTVLNVRRLPDAWRARFEALEADPRQVPRDSLAKYARPEVSPRYHERLAADWRMHVRSAAAKRPGSG